MITKLKDGDRSYGDGSGLRWLYYSRLDDEQIEYVKAIYELHEYSGGVGKYFQKEPIIIHSKSRTLILQSYGYDI